MRKVIGMSAMAAVYLAGCSVLPGVKQYDTLEDGPGRILTSGDNANSEAFSELGNKSPYSVNGRFYYVMEDPSHYRARGKASWYGDKLQGRKTSSGETFDKYALTAAHRNLPLPTYLEVTNLDNGKVAIVKVNDRGPFVDDRLIDLSYAAAVKLDMLEKGGAPVEVRAVTGADVARAREQIERDAAEARQLAGGAKTPTAAEDLAPALEVASVDGAAEEVSDDTVKTAEQVADASTTIVTEQAQSVPAAVVAAAPVAAPTAPVAPAEVVEDSVSEKPLALQLGAFSKLEGATAYMEKAQALVPAIPAFVTEGLSGDRAIYRVRVGPVNSKRLIAEATAALAEGGIENVRVLPMQGAGDCVAGCR